MRRTDPSVETPITPGPSVSFQAGDAGPCLRVPDPGLAPARGEEPTPREEGEEVDPVGRDLEGMKGDDERRCQPLRGSRLPARHATARSAATDASGRERLTSDRLLAGRITEAPEAPTIERRVRRGPWGPRTRRRPHSWGRSSRKQSLPSTNRAARCTRRRVRRGCRAAALHVQGRHRGTRRA